MATCDISAKVQQVNCPCLPLHSVNIRFTTQQQCDLKALHYTVEMCSEA
jgi:hypothetical protein